MEDKAWMGGWVGGWVTFGKPAVVVVHNHGGDEGLAWKRWVGGLISG